MLIDSHCHLDMLKGNLEKCLLRAKEKGVEYVLSVGTTLEGSSKTYHLTKMFQNIGYSVGIHPLNVSSHQNVTTLELIDASSLPYIIALGESGLDYSRPKTPKALQHTLFLRHIEAARKTALPLIIHARNADEDMKQLLEEEYAKEPFQGVLHCFASSKALAETALSLGFYLGFTGLITFPNASPIASIARQCPLEKILIETDSPYLAPVPHRGKPNEPAYVYYVASALATLRNTPLKTIASATTNNFLTLFPKANHSLSSS